MATLNAWCHPKTGYVFRAEDTCIGIALEDTAKALAPFGWIKIDLNRRYESTKIGLSVITALEQILITRGRSLRRRSNFRILSG